MAYDLGTILNNSTNNTANPLTVAGLKASIAGQIPSDTTGELQSLLNGIVGFLQYDGLKDSGLVTPASSTLTGSNETLYTTSANADLTVSGSGTVQSPVYLLAGESSKLVLQNLAHGAVNAHQAHAGGDSSAKYDVLLSGGNNTVTLNHGPTQIISTTGNDQITSKGGFDTIISGSGHDTITAGGHSDVHAGSAGDTITGGLTAKSFDTISGGSGSDQIVVLHGNNLLIGANGDSYMQAGDGLDTIQGGTGHQTIWGSGSTYIEAGRNNIIHAQGSDTVVGGDGPDTILSTGSGQLIQGSQGHLDVFVSKHTSDTIFGGSSNDVVHINQLQSDVTNTTTSGQVTTITFANGQTLQTSNVTIDFKHHS